MDVIGTLHFEKALAQEFLDAIQNGRAIAPPRDGNEALTLAGVLHYLVGVRRFDPYLGRLSTMSAEYREAIREDAINGTSRTIEMAAGLAAMIASGDYDAEYLPHIDLALVQDEDGRIGVHVKPA